MGLVAEANKALVQQNLDLQAELTSTIQHHSQFQSEIMLSNKRRSQVISSLWKVVSTQTEKLHRAERAHESASKKLKKENKFLVERLHDTRETVLEKQRDISSLKKEKETIKQEVDKAYKRGVSEGRRQETGNKITLPAKVDESTLAELIKAAFAKVHKKKKPHQCAAIAAKAVWNLYDGNCPSFLEEWTTEQIRNRTPTAKAKRLLRSWTSALGSSTYPDMRGCKKA